MQTITEQFPPLPLDELLYRIGQFQTSTVEEKHRLISDLVKIHPILSHDYSTDHVFKRIRKIGKDDYPQHIQDLLWRKDGIANIGRANPEGFPVIYVADKLDTALRETHINDDFVLLGELKVRNDCTCRVVPIGEMMHVQRTGSGYLLGSAGEELNNMLNACNPVEAKSLLIADSFLYECILKDDDKYLISSFVAKSIFEKNASVSAVAYPSVRQHGAINFAIRTDHFWKSWSIVGARRMQVKHLAYGYFESSNTEHVTGITRKGRLHWDKGLIDDKYSQILDPPWIPEAE